MKESPLLGNRFWRLLFTAIRDKECKPIGSDKKMPILEGGHVRLMTMEDIEDKFFSENPNMLTSFINVPDQMIHEDLIDSHLNTESVKESLRKSYEGKLAEARETLAAENPKWKKEEVEKQAAVQAKKEVKRSSEAKSLQNRVAMMAEHEVQKSIKRAMEEYQIPVFIFRGVNTYDDVGRLLESFGIKMSKLKAFKSWEASRTLETDHEIATINFFLLFSNIFELLKVLLKGFSRLQLLIRIGRN